MIAITYDDVVKTARELPKDRANPMEREACLYTGPDGRHCIAGEILTRLGVKVPPYGDDNNSLGVGGLLDDLVYQAQAIDIDNETCRLFMQLQESADDFTTRNYTDAWGCAVRDVLDA